jgi:hypothetical protein
MQYATVVDNNSNKFLTGTTISKISVTVIVKSLVLLCMWEALGSNLSLKISYPE